MKNPYGLAVEKAGKMGVSHPLLYKVKTGVLWLARPHILLFALPWLMAILVLGTLAQKDIGLYAAQARYFSSFIIWLGPLPLPGSYPTLGVIFVSLLAKFLFASPWHRAQAGTLLTHLGILLLLFGGLITGITAKEFFIVIPEGGKSVTLSSYHDRVLAVEKTDGTVIAAYPFDDLARGSVLTPAEGIHIEIDKTCRHCTAQSPADDRGRMDMAEKMDLIDAPSQPDDEMNLSGVTFTITTPDEKLNGTYIMLEDIPVRPTFGDIVVYVRRAQENLPFSIGLNDFVEERHPGTATARAFHSDVVVDDNGVNWPARIEMNEPLRYKGYTFYQSSFTRGMDGKESTVLSAVQNAGRIFPYVASAVIFAGLLLHLILRLRGTAKGKA